MYSCFTENEEEECWKRGTVQAEAQNLARRLADAPSNHMTPSIFCENAREVLKNLDVDVHEHDAEWAKNNNMNAFLSVSRGSCEPPKFLEMSYRNGDKSSQPYVLIGNSICV